MNLQGMLTRARMKLRDLSVRTFNESELLVAANEGKDELAKIIRQARSDFFVTTATGTIPIVAAPNPSTITLPSDFAELKTIEITAVGYEWIGFLYLDRADPRFRIALIEGGSMAAGNAAFYYDIIGLQTMELSPGSDIALTYKIYYVPTLADMALPTDSPSTIPAEHHEFIVTWMIMEALRSLADPRLDGYRSKLDYQTKSIIESISTRQIREAQFVRGFMEEEGW